MPLAVWRCHMGQSDRSHLATDNSGIAATTELKNFRDTSLALF
jgi:hypothetical protein